MLEADAELQQLTAAEQVAMRNAVENSARSVRPSHFLIKATWGAPTSFVSSARGRVGADGARSIVR